VDESDLFNRFDSYPNAINTACKKLGRVPTLPNQANPKDYVDL